MMTEAYVFVNCLLTMTGVVENVAKITEGVLETHPTTGIYDLILKVKAVDETSLQGVLSKIKGIQGVASTLTSVIYR
jgi:DNA-binding Lrp family transcriptional regulator